MKGSVYSAARASAKRSQQVRSYDHTLQELQRASSIVSYGFACKAQRTVDASAPWTHSCQSSDIVCKKQQPAIVELTDRFPKQHGACPEDGVLVLPRHAVLMHNTALKYTGQE